ncbi:uncharacterized protein LOC113339565 [Papaver somniferum]|uniref:uncharacterized protein LOC113339565 n=1 Tax=Papaver somniferum TaxID=3469 RepID=UPI000E6F7655|nr:uncharacterized protein LOC113339565 [Papaver somniferum]
MAKLIDVSRSLRLLLAFLILVVVIHESVEGRTIAKASNKAILKTLKGDNDEIVDCYDVYKQPSLNNPLLQNQTIQQAKIILQGDGFRGAQAKINIWKPVTEPGEYSASIVSVAAGDDGGESINVGWQVNSALYGDNEARFFVFWTADNSKSTGCYDLKCTGFVQTSSVIYPGITFNPIAGSVFQGTQYDATFSIFQDQSTGNWWVQYQGSEVGYYPPSLFKQLSIKGTAVHIGGLIFNTRNQGRHTATQMGSGHLPSEGKFGVSSYFSQVKVIDGNNIARDPKTVVVYQTNPNCYGLSVDHHQHLQGYGFFYGGPGFSYNCQ